MQPTSQEAMKRANGQSGLERGVSGRGRSVSDYPFDFMKASTSVFNAVDP
jgi:hypothetical protein